MGFICYQMSASARSDFALLRQLCKWFQYLCPIGAISYGSTGYCPADALPQLSDFYVEQDWETLSQMEPVPLLLLDREKPEGLYRMCLCVCVSVCLGFGQSGRVFSSSDVSHCFQLFSSTSFLLQGAMMLMQRLCTASSFKFICTGPLITASGLKPLFFFSFWVAGLISRAEINMVHKPYIIR